jgi:putative lipoic acid-binding regulatory protein
MRAARLLRRVAGPAAASRRRPQPRRLAAAPGGDGESRPAPPGTTVSEAQAINLRAVRPADALVGKAESLAKSLGQERSPASRLVLGDDQSEEKWRALDERVNEYPDSRVFKGIGVAGADPSLFRAAVVAAVESVVGPVDAGAVAVRDSSGGKYVSVTVGPVTVESGDDVVRVFAAMRELAGPALKYYI